MKKEIDMINKSLFPQMMRFAIPIVMSSVLQTLYNAADSLIVGRYGSSNALAAVGTVGPIVNVILNLFMGLAVGTNVIAARYFGAANHEMVKRTSDTALVTALLSGILAGLLGIFIAAPVAEVVRIDPEIIDMSVLYMQIYFLGLPFTAIYNFAASTMRGIGNTKGPMVCLVVSGMVNVVFNVIFVKYCGMQVEGVAIATVISQVVSAVMIICMLKKSRVGFSLKEMKPDKNIFKYTLKIGIPAGIQGMIFNISNTITISAVNSFGAAAAAANTVAGQIEGIIYVAINSITQTVTTFVSQNIGAQKPERLNKILVRGLAISIVGGILMSAGFYVFRDFFNELFAPGDADVAKYSLIKFDYVIIPYFLVAFMEIPAGMLRGMNETFIAMLMSLLGVCGFRVVWQLLIFPMHRTLGFLYISYPISWLGTGLVYFAAYIILKKRLDKNITSGTASLSM
mgnify:CR=1 FL=1